MDNNISIKDLNEIKKRYNKLNLILRLLKYDFTPDEKENALNYIIKRYFIDNK